MAARTAPLPSGLDYLRVLLPALPGARLVPRLRRGDALPTRTVELDDVRVDRDHLAAYSRLCGFDVRNTLPATYPHVLGFAAQLRLMADPAFPFPALGVVHVANSITVHRPLDTGSPLDLRVSARNLRPHPRGRQLDLVTRALVDGAPVWEDVSTYLSRGGGDPQAQRPGPALDGPLASTPGSVTWRLPADLGRRYAAVSGDRNPIHLNPLLARAFGFPRTIAHGMWTAARALAAVQHRLPASYRYDVAFGSPVLLPSTLTLAVLAGDAPGHADLQVSGRGRIHLAATLDGL